VHLKQQKKWRRPAAAPAPDYAITSFAPGLVEGRMPFFSKIDFSICLLYAYEA
jgi:hypothetical protein